MLSNLSLRFARPILVLYLLSLSVISCKKENQVAKLPPAQTANIATLSSFLSETTGTPVNKVIFDSTQKRFVIDGDMIMSLEGAMNHYANSSKFNNESDGGRITQRRYPLYTNIATAGVITVYIDPNVGITPDWETAINQAIANWNNSDCAIKITKVADRASSYIYFYTYYENKTPPEVNSIAYGDFPSSVGGVGRKIGINTYYNSNDILLPSYKQTAITHEFGHCFGLTHTDITNEGVLIPETPDAADIKSVMHSVAHAWTGFTFYDIISYGIVFPRAANTKRFLRYYSSNLGRHTYTLSSTEISPGGSFGFEKGEGYLYPTSQPGTIPLYRYYNSSRTDHVFTVNINEFGVNGSGGYAPEGIAGYLYATQVAGTRPLYRYRSTNVYDHIYTTDYNELGAGNSGTAFESIVGYVY